MPPRSKNRPEARRVGALRPSQMTHAFGIGSLVDLPNFTTIVSGLDLWDQSHQAQIVEPRLLRSVRALLGAQVEELRAAPWMEETKSPFDEWARVGIPVFPFPRWLRCTRCNRLELVDRGLFKLDVPPFRPDRARYYHEGCGGPAKKPTAIPARFVLACPAGHLDDFPWVQLAHKDGPCIGEPKLVLKESGYATRSTDQEVRCETCGGKGPVAIAFGSSAERFLPKCRGRHPHLRRFEPGGCRYQAEALLLGASNSWFPVRRSALSIPAGGSELEQAVSGRWTFLEEVSSLDELKRGLRFGELAALRKWDADEIWQVIEARRADTAEDEEQVADLRSPEWVVFTGPPTKAGEDFETTAGEAPEGFDDLVEPIVVVDRLREVAALCGFTRLTSPDAIPTVLAPRFRAPISGGPPRWLPAAETRGEGLFLQLPEPSVVAWEDRYGDSDSFRALLTAHRSWMADRGIDPDLIPVEPRDVLIHSLAHILINEVALECGYSTASIRERLYVRIPDEQGRPMAGILLYTAAPDSEGTLGGLVALGEPQTLGRLLSQALERTRLCSSDPLCADHEPGDLDGTLHGAACHACLFLPETSCERGNRYLDRAAVVDTLSVAGVSYFG